jgi:hypothetical protein
LLLPLLGVDQIPLYRSSGFPTTRAPSLLVYESTPPGYAEIGEVEATDCKNNIVDPEPTRDRALAQLKFKALAMNADAVSAVSYDGSVINLWQNCWASVTARGKALKKTR